jgi:hypothetical protein
MSLRGERRCPLCGGDNACGRARGQDCWCFSTPMSREVLDRVAPRVSDVCVCQSCAATTPSPCIGVCELDRATQTCRGCHRTLDEIAGWSRFCETERRAVVRRLQAVQRRLVLGQRALPDG